MEENTTNTGAITEGAVEQAPVTSQVTEGQSESTSSEANETETGTDTGVAPEGADLSDPELVAEAEAEVKAPRSQYRVKDLAERLSQREQELNALRGQLVEQHQQTSQYQDQIGIGNGTVQEELALIRSRQLIQEAAQALKEGEAEFTKAATKYPELDPESKDYDRNFDDAVYSMVQARGISYTQAAETVKQIQKSAYTRAYSKAEQEIGLKSTNSVQPNTKGRGSESVEQEVHDSKVSRYKSTGKVEDLINLLAGN